MRKSTRILLIGAALTAQMFSAGCQGLGGLASLFGGGSSTTGDLFAALFGGNGGGLVDDFAAGAGGAGGADFGGPLGDGVLDQIIGGGIGDLGGLSDLGLFDDLGWPGDGPGIGAPLGDLGLDEYVGGGEGDLPGGGIVTTGLGGAKIHNPEPGSIALFGTGLAALSFARRKKRRQA